MKKIFRLALPYLAASLLATACGFEHSGTSLTPTAPPSSTGGSYVGTWISSTPAGVPRPNTCGDFEWRITNQFNGIISGVFMARCAGNLNVSGSAWGTPTGTTAPYTTTAGASGPGVTACSVSMTGTATLDGDTLRMPYAGSTCLGRVSGTEILRRH